LALRAYAAEICDAEVARALARLQGLSAPDAFVVRALGERIVGKVLDRPMALLEAHAEGANMARVLRQLFRLEPGWPRAEDNTQAASLEQTRRECGGA